MLHPLRDRLAELSSTALLAPQREVHAFPGSPTQRIDLVLYRGFGHRQALLDVVITHALTPHGLLSPGRAASAYEAIKSAEYGHLVDPASQILVPVVTDTFGGWGEAAQQALQVVSRAFASRCVDGRGGRLAFFAALNGTLMRAIAGMLLSNVLPLDA